MSRSESAISSTVVGNDDQTFVTEAMASEASSLEPRVSGYRFSLGQLHFVDNSNSLLEVLDLPELTKVAGTADWFAGLATVHSEMLPVTDFRAWLGILGQEQARDQERCAGESDPVIASDNRGSKPQLLVVQQRIGQSDNSDGHSVSGYRKINDSKSDGEQIGLIVDQVIGHTGALAASVDHATNPADELTNPDVQSLSPSDWLDRLLSGATVVRDISASHEQRIASLVSRVLDEVLIVGEQTLLIGDLSRLLTIPSLRDIRSDSGKRTLPGIGVSA